MTLIDNHASRGGIRVTLGWLRGKWVMTSLVALAVLFTGIPAMADYRYEAEFSEVGILAVGAYGQIEDSLDLDEEECQKLVADMVYGELRAKLPSLLILNDQESTLVALDTYVEEQSMAATGADEVVTEDQVKLQDLLHRAAWVDVSVDIFKSNSGGYFGSIGLKVKRPVQLLPSPSQPKNSSASRTFRATVYDRGYNVTRGVPYGVKESVKNVVSDLLTTLISDFYAARPDL